VIASSESVVQTISQSNVTLLTTTQIESQSTKFRKWSSMTVIKTAILSH